MMTTQKMAVAVENDAQLVEWSITGDREAFARIVERYQSLVCSITYGATGSLSLSEDLAQETFVTAWKQLPELREPSKLRAWLCGITRFLIGKELRRQSREPVHAAEPLDAVQEPLAPEPSPSARAISREEEAILWRALEQMPATYREPLILFYREQQSVERVALELELSEDAVKQRLSRGRTILTEQVTAFVEGTLKRTTPGKAFTVGVLAALPLMATSVKAAAVAATAARGSTVAKSATLVAIFNALFGPIVGVLGAYFGVRASLEAARTPRERQFVVRQTKIMIFAAVLINMVVFAYILAAVRFWKAHPLFFTVFGVGMPLFFTAFILARAFRWNREFGRVRAEQQQRHPELFQGETGERLSAVQEYRSRWTLFGLPLVHIRGGHHLAAGQKVQPAVGWIAIGDRAYGILFAGGSVAVGGVSMGGVSLGIIAMGGASAGLLAIGGFALGGLAVGGGAIGVVAAGGFATGWLGAEGGLAIAREFALGGQALAHHANDLAARDYFAQYPWLDLRNPHPRNLFTSLCWLPMLLVIWQSIRIRKALRENKTSPRIDG